MVLDHVPQRPGIVVVRAATLDADALRDGDLDVIDSTAVPNRLEQRVGEAQGHEVLDGLLPEIVVDPIDLLLGEDLADLVVDGAGGDEIVADRLLQHDSGRLGHQTSGAEPTGERAEKLGRGREIEDAGTLLVLAQGLGEVGPTGVVGGVQGNVAKELEEFLQRLAVAQLRVDMLLDGLADHLPVGVVLEDPPRGAEDAAALRHLAVAEPPEQRGQELALGEIARAAEDDDVERLDRNDAWRHERDPPVRWHAPRSRDDPSIAPIVQQRQPRDRPHRRRAKPLVVDRRRTTSGALQARPAPVPRSPCHAGPV